MRKITGIITEKLHSIFDMQRRIVTKVTKITSKLHTDTKIYNLSRIVMSKRLVTHVLLDICNYCNYSITDSVFRCNFSCNSCVTNVIFLSRR